MRFFETFAQGFFPQWLCSVNVDGLTSWSGLCFQTMLRYFCPKSPAGDC
jgi:hypothetical protein